MVLFEFSKKVSETGELNRCGICQESHTAQIAATDAQVRSVQKKRGGFVGSGPSKPPFAPMRGVGEGEKSINCYEAIRREFVAGYWPAISSKKLFSPCCLPLVHEECHEGISRRAASDVTADEELIKHLCSLLRSGAQRRCSDWLLPLETPVS